MLRISRSPLQCLLPLLVSGMLSGGLRLDAQTQPPKNYVLQWSDNFSGGVLDATKWNYRTDVKARSAQTPANVSVDSQGHMNIALRRENFAGKEYTGGGIVSKASFRYGYFEVKAKTTTNPGWHSSFWMFAGNGVTTFAPGGLTEIDDFEINSEAPEVISMGRLEWSNGKATASQRCNANYRPGWSTASGYHTYGLEWTEEEINYFLDGAKICSQPYPFTQYTHDPLNIWLTAIGYSPGVAVTDPSSPVSFANVAFYIRDYYIGDREPGYVEYGPGWQDNSVPGYSNIPTRVSCQAQAFASYTPTILQDGKYDVQIYRVAHSDGDPAAQLSILSAAGHTARTVDFAHGNNGWVDLGVYRFNLGSTGFLKMSNSGSGCTRTSMVKFVRR